MRKRLPPEFEAVMRNDPKSLRALLGRKKKTKIIFCPVSDSIQQSGEDLEKEIWPYNEMPSLRWLEGDTMWDLATRNTCGGCALLLIKRGLVNEDSLFWPRFRPIELNSPLMEISAPRVGHFVNLISCPGGHTLAETLINTLTPEELSKSWDRFSKDILVLGGLASQGYDWSQRGLNRVMECALTVFTMDVAKKLNNYQPFKTLIDVAMSQPNAQDYMISFFANALKLYEKSKFQLLLKENPEAFDVFLYGMFKCREVLGLPSPEPSAVSPQWNDKRAISNFLDEHAAYLTEWCLRKNTKTVDPFNKVKI